jgi:hypothetical protein
VNANRDGFHQREMFQHNAIATRQASGRGRAIRFHVNCRVGGIVRM